MSSTVFSFPVMIAFALAALTVLTARGRFNDPDTWWHLKVGEIIWKSHTLPRTDLFSHTTGNHPWVPHEWLAQLSLYATYQSSGYRGLLLWLCALASLVFVLTYAYSSLYSGNPKVAFLGALMGWFFGTVGISIRPLILGHVFLALELLLVHFGRTKNRLWFLALPPVFLLWVNCHGSYVLGLLVLGIFAFCSFIDLRIGALASIRWRSDDRRLFCLACLLCGAALLFNPVGPKLLTYPLDVFTRQSVGLGNVIEWQPLDITDPRGIGLFAAMGILFLFFVVRELEIRLEELLLLLLAFTMALKHIRLVFACGILVAPIFSRLLAAWDEYEPRRNRIANGVLMVAAIVTMVLGFPEPAEIDRQIKASNPVGAVEFIRRAGLPGQMLNEFEWGGYLIWALPEHKVFIDGRADVFDWTGVFAEYGRWASLKEDPKLLLDKYRVHFCLLRKEAPLAFVLPYLPGWRRVYVDGLAVVFARE